MIAPVRFVVVEGMVKIVSGGRLAPTGKLCVGAMLLADVNI